MSSIQHQRENILSFLYLLDRNKKIDRNFYDQLFHFNKLNNNFLENKMSKTFIVDNYEVIDIDRSSIFKTLKFYSFVNKDFEITSEGKRYLAFEIENNNWLKDAVYIFEKEYNGETMFENSTLSNFDKVSINCYYEDYNIAKKIKK